MSANLTRFFSAALLVVASFSDPCFADAFADAARADAQSIGASSTAAVLGNLSEQPVRELTPGYTANPPETSITAMSMNAATATLLTLCQGQSSASDPTCEAINKARSDAARKNATAPLTNDPSVKSAIAATQGAVIGGIASGYSGCSPKTTTSGKQYYTSDACFNYYQRSPDQSCIKNLKVSISWACAAGATDLRVDGAGNHICTRASIAYKCATGESLGIDKNGQWICTTPPPPPPPVKPGEPTPTPASPSVRPADPYTVYSNEPAVPTVTQWWENGCAAMESRVPAGMLPPDGQNPSSGRITLTGSPNKCMRSSSICSDPSPTTRVFDTVPVTNACWQYSNQFDCLDTIPLSDCDQPRWGSCTKVGEMTCIEHDPIDQTICTAQKQNFTCLAADTIKTETVADCTNQVFTDDSGIEWNTGHKPNTDLPRAVAYMEAAREGGSYMTGDINNLEIFKGFDNRCVKKLFGLVNCCKKTGGINLSGFSNFAILVSTGKTVGKAMASTYTRDMLFASDAPGMLKKGFEYLFDGGYQSTLAGFIAGKVGLSELMTSFVPGPWSIALMAIQLSGLTSCPQKEQITSIKRGANLCVDLGDYCSREFKAAFFKVCVERTQSACCFNSKLAKIVNVQGKAQLGRSMGWGSAPNCSGFTVSDFQKLDLSRMDLSEFMEEVKAQAVDVAGTAARANPASCYYGTNGKCN